MVVIKICDVQPTANPAPVWDLSVCLCLCFCGCQCEVKRSVLSVLSNIPAWCAKTDSTGCYTRSSASCCGASPAVPAVLFFMLQLRLMSTWRRKVTCLTCGRCFLMAPGLKLQLYKVTATSLSSMYEEEERTLWLSQRLDALPMSWITPSRITRSPSHVDFLRSSPEAG